MVGVKLPSGSACDLGGCGVLELSDWISRSAGLVPADDALELSSG